MSEAGSRDTSTKGPAIRISPGPSPGALQLDEEEFPSLDQAAIVPRRKRWPKDGGQDAPNLEAPYAVDRGPALGQSALVSGHSTLHPITNTKANSAKKSLNVDSPSFTPTQLQPGAKKFTFSSQAANAAPFTPKAVGNSCRFASESPSNRIGILIHREATPSTLTQDAEGPIFNPAAIREFTPQTPNYDLNTATATNGTATDSSNVYDPFSMSAISQSIPAAQFNPYAEDPTGGMAGGGTSFYPAQGAYAAPIQPLQYHLYAPVGPYRSDLSNYQRQAHDFFLREDIREEMQKKSEATRQVLPGSQLPSVAHYHSLVPLDSVRGGKSIFGEYLTWLYKADSKKNGNIYCLRRLQGVRSITKESVGVIARWKRVNCGNVVSVIECFTSRDFNDMSLIFIHNYHPLSRTLAEHHFGANSQGRFVRPPPVPESVLWSYICQMCNALKAIHAENLAARCIDLSKVILTDRSRIRLSACAIQDVLEHETARPILELQLEDFVQLGRMILSIGTNTATLHNLQVSMAQFGGLYSQELRDRVVWLLTTPGTPEQATQKTVHELARGISDHIVDSFDSCLHASDEINSNLYRELENGRIARLMMKLGAINERPEFENDPSWSENGERYQLKLFRDYVFHQVDANGNPVVDMAHMLGCLNKLDAGSEERVYLTSRDHQTAFVVTYRELKKQVASAFNELLKPNHSKQAGPRGY
ncbi:hypothetical protein PG991_000852 [Apiospora marii]|uniref:PAN2-PAN3 deadenylation complex subunit PAN3 n=1 Tax=Apiospora marii TaxID=335849 RepID=A0ABR1SUI5_9PEZI